MAGDKDDSKAASLWKNASAANQAKFHLTELPENFQPTKEEEALVNMYQTIRQFERQAGRLKEQKAREKLAAKENEFKQSQANKHKKRRRKRVKAPTASGDEVSDGSSSEEDYSSDEEQEQTLQDRRTAKLDALRDEVDEAKKAMVADEVKEAKLRKNLLETNDADISGPSLKRKKLQETGDEGGLLSNMKIDTPPHEFSERLNIKSWKGKTLFPSTPDEKQWTPPEGVGDPNVGAFLVELPDFDITKAQNGTGNNTIVIKFHAPNDSKRFRFVYVNE